MKILVTLATNFSESKYKPFLDGVDFLKKQGHNISFDSAKKGDKNAKNKLDKLIRDADIVLTEISESDLKTGFNIAKAMNEKKIVIALEKDVVKDTLSDHLNVENNRNLLVKKYNQKSVDSVLESAVEEAKKLMDTKFILIISPEIDRYLDWASQTKRLHKAQIVRNSVEQMIKKDKEYKTYLGE